MLQESLTRNIGHFSRFLEIASFSQGSVINTSEIDREAHIERATAENYFSILEDLLIGVCLPVFSRKAKRKLIRLGYYGIVTSSQVRKDYSHRKNGLL